MQRVLPNDLKQKIDSYKKRFYLNQLLKGTILFVALFIAMYLGATIAEYTIRFSRTIRAVLFFGIVGISISAFYLWIAKPYLYWLQPDKGITDDEAAIHIGSLDSEIGDKLLNIIQLNRTDSANELVRAAVSIRANEWKIRAFHELISLYKNKEYIIRFLLIPSLVFLTIWIWNSSLFTESTERLVKYNKDFPVPAPFEFVLLNEQLTAYYQEDFNINLRLEGKKIPTVVYLVNDNQRITLPYNTDKKVFEYTFTHLEKDQEFHLEAAGYSSSTYNLAVHKRPLLIQMSAHLQYPSHVGKRNEILKNVGSLIVPEGTNIKWIAKAENASLMKISFSNPSFSKNISPSKDVFLFDQNIKESTKYTVRLANDFSVNKEPIAFDIDVIKDQHPSLELQEQADTISYRYLLLGGSITDDYGFSNLCVDYRIVPDNNQTSNKPFKRQKIAFQSRQNAQKYFHELALDTLGLKPGYKCEYQVSVWDNDQVNGFKKATSGLHTFKMPDVEELKDQHDQQSDQVQQDMAQSMEKAQQIRKELNKIKEKLKSKKQTDWQDKKDLDKLIQKQEDLKKELEQLAEKFNNNREQAERMDENKELAEKYKQLEQLIKELNDPETKALLEELQKMMEKQANIDQIQKKLDELQQKDKNLSNELDRSIEMFKQLKLEQKMEQTANQLKQLAKEQEKLAEKTLDQKSNTENLSQEQQKIEEKFKEIQEDMKEMDELNKSMEKEQNFDPMDEKQQSTKEQLQQSKQSLDQNKRKPASKSQKDAAKQMKEMGEQLASMGQQMESQQAQENIDDLRAILENLLKLSFEQEILMKEFRKINQLNPKYIGLAQRQMKLKDDSKVVEDSLLALAKRVFQIQSFVTREMADMKKYMDESAESIKARQPQAASGKQQYAMTSINNLTLMLSDVLSQMQQQMAQQMKGNQNCKKPGNGKPNLSELQKQLNQKLKDMKNGTKSGRELSEELAKMAAQQEMIRRALKEMEAGDNSTNQSLKQKLRDLQKTMEDTEKDIVNKNITDRTIQRQQDIMTRLLEAEKASREREYDNDRESKTGKDAPKRNPTQLNPFISRKQRQIEMLKTIPPAMIPYYKREVSEYFQSIE